MADHLPIFTALGLSLHPTPATSRCWAVEPHVDHKEFTFTPLSPPRNSMPTTLLLFPVSGRFQDSPPPPAKNHQVSENYAKLSGVSHSGTNNHQDSDHSSELSDAALSLFLGRKQSAKNHQDSENYAKSSDAAHCLFLGEKQKTNNHQDSDHSSELSDAALSLFLGGKQSAKKQSALKEESPPRNTIRPRGDQRNWITKRLSLSDVNNASRLLMAKEDVEKHVLASMADEKNREACRSIDGFRVKVWDTDTLSEHELSLKRWSTGCYLLTSNWSREFVKRRGLKEGDWIGLLWDYEKLGFFFSKLNA